MLRLQRSRIRRVDPVILLKLMFLLFWDNVPSERGTDGETTQGGEECEFRFHRCVLGLIGFSD